MAAGVRPSAPTQLVTRRPTSLASRSTPLGVERGSKGGAGSGCGVGIGGEQDRHQIDARDAIDHAVVDLLHDREALAALETFRDPELPERPRAVERLRDQPPDQALQLPFVARPRQRGVAHVVLELEVRVVHPDRMVLDGDQGEALPVARQPMEARRHVGAHALDVDAAVGPGQPPRLEHRDRRDVLRLVRRSRSRKVLSVAPSRSYPSDMPPTITAPRVSRGSSGRVSSTGSARQSGSSLWTSLTRALTGRASSPSPRSCGSAASSVGGIARRALEPGGVALRIHDHGHAVVERGDRPAAPGGSAA